MKKRLSEKESIKKGFIWYGVRISFYLLIAIWVLYIILQYSLDGANLNSVTVPLSFIWFFCLIFNFVTSIMHLFKYEKKVFAIVSLIISSILLLLFILGFVLGLLIIMGRMSP